MNFLRGSCKLLIFRTSHPHFAGLSTRGSRKDAKFAKGSSVTLCELCVFARDCLHFLKPSSRPSGFAIRRTRLHFVEFCRVHIKRREPDKTRWSLQRENTPILSGGRSAKADHKKFLTPGWNLK
jgi:hypothetical protein